MKRRTQTTKNKSSSFFYLNFYDWRPSQSNPPFPIKIFLYENEYFPEMKESLKKTFYFYFFYERKSENKF